MMNLWRGVHSTWTYQDWPSQRHGAVVEGGVCSSEYLAVPAEPWL